MPNDGNRAPRRRIVAVAIRGADAVSRKLHGFFSGLSRPFHDASAAS
jgi:hypothetical protein